MQLVASLRWLILVVVAVIVGSAQSAFAQSLTVAWDPSADPSVVGYIVYAGRQSGEYTSTFDVGNATSFVYGVVPDQTYFFAVASYAENGVAGSLSPEVSGSADATVLLTNPGDRISVVGQPASLQLEATDSSGGDLTFSASGLPQGLAIDPKTGLIYGAPLDPGTYTIVASASNGSKINSQTFVWTVTPASTDVTAPAVTITMPTTSARFTTPDGYVTLGGIALDDGAVTAVSWANDRGDGGSATGTDTWLVAVPLHSAQNRITVTATDAAGNRGTATIVIRKSNQ